MKVWPLVYSRKGDAVRALANDFTEDYDYQSLRKNAKRGIGSTTSYSYNLSVSCMEWFVARKVREVFEVYREVFHRVADMAEQAVDKNYAGLVALINDQTEKILGLERKLSSLRHAQTEYFKASVVRPVKQPVIDKSSRRFRAMEMVSKYVATREPNDLTGVWDRIWNIVETLYKVDVRKLNQLPGEHLLDTAIRSGYEAQAWEVIFSKYGFWS